MSYRIDIKLLEFLFSIILLTLIGYFYTANFSSIFDINLWDETNYLEWGLKIEQNGLPIARGVRCIAYGITIKI